MTCTQKYNTEEHTNSDFLKSATFFSEFLLHTQVPFFSPTNRSKTPKFFLPGKTGIFNGFFYFSRGWWWRSVNHGVQICNKILGQSRHHHAPLFLAKGIWSVYYQGFSRCLQSCTCASNKIGDRENPPLFPFDGWLHFSEYTRFLAANLPKNYFL